MKKLEISDAEVGWCVMRMDIGRHPIFKWVCGMPNQHSFLSIYVFPSGFLEFVSLVISRMGGSKTATYGHFRST